jgi:hypothetical protein
MHTPKAHNQTADASQNRIPEPSVYSHELAEVIAERNKLREQVKDLLAACKVTLANLAPKYCNDHLVMQSLRDAIAKAESN